MNRVSSEGQLRRSATDDQQRDAGNQGGERNPLRVGKPEMQALLVEAEKLDDEARGGIKRQIPAENRARGVRLADPEIEESKNQRVGDALVELRGMQRNAERHAGEIGGLRVAERHRPWHMRCDAPAAARRKTADAADGLAYRDARRENVAGGKDRQMLAPHVKNGRHECDQESALVYARRLQRAQREQRIRIVPIGLENRTGS